MNTNQKIVIFACVHNAGRSQMAAAFFNKYSDVTKAKAISAGTEPAERVHPEVQSVMSELGFNLSTAKPTRLTSALAETANLLVTMGCGEKCPYVAGLKIIDWQLEDPKGKGLESVRLIRDKIKNLVSELIVANGWSINKANGE
jgi:arsenate reductase (thioredoxin)